MSRPMRKTYNRLHLPSESDSIESNDDVDLEQRLNLIRRRNRLISSTSESDNQSDENNGFIGPQPKVKTRKRLRKAECHKKSIAKKLRNSGERYVNVNGQITANKTFSDTPCSCKMACHEKITTEERQSMFQSFWKLGDFKRQNTYICGLIQRTEIKQRRPRKEGGILRCGANKYFLKTSQGMSVAVCKKYFLSTFCVSDGRVTRALKKISEGKLPGEDLRGIKGCPSRKIAEEDIEYVCKHIESFPSYQSHYTRKNNEHRRYLCDALNIRKMYSLYAEKCQEEQKSPVKEHFYRYVFNTKFNLHFYIPKKDTCKKCDTFKIKISNPELSRDELSQLNIDHELHLRKAELARECMKTDAENVKKNPDSYVCSIDLQKALPFPVLSASDAYYKRNMYCYNFGVHNLETEAGVFYFWDETIASRGSQEVSSCVIKHLKLHAPNKKHVIIYSDTCTGQNRNIKMALALIRFLQSNETDIEVIDQKFLVSGHSFLPNDSDFGSVELAAKGKAIYLPNDWEEIMTTCRRKKKFIVCQMSNDEFFSTSTLEKNITNRKKIQAKQK